MTPAEEKGLVVGEYYVRFIRMGEQVEEFLVTYVKDHYNPKFEYQSSRDNMHYILHLSTIRHLTPEEKTELLLGINPFTKEII